ncbi:hypothetical protein [Sinomonas flava]|uniref:hypothetical protein n=1 Tax=Sinomonas flava TaxID=496857 RepID=UPI0039A5DDDB
MSTATSSGPQGPGLGAMALPRPSSGAIVTAEAYDGAAHRCGAGAFTLVSLDPPWLSSRSPAAPPPPSAWATRPSPSTSPMRPGPR